jgi:hypothetical protein
MLLHQLSVCNLRPQISPVCILFIQNHTLFYPVCTINEIPALVCIHEFVIPMQIAEAPNTGGVKQFLCVG